MATIADRRAKFMAHLTTVLDLLDPSGDNSKSYHELLDSKSDAEFDKWAREFFRNRKKQLYLEIVEYERDLTLENIKKAAEYMKVPLFERVAIPYLTEPGNPIVVTPEPVAVGYVHDKRMQQTLMKKSGGSLSIEKINPKTGQVSGADKNARNTDVETYALLAQGAHYALKEFMGPRADDKNAAKQMYNEIAKKGFVEMKDIADDRYDKVSLNTLDSAFLLQGISTNLVAPLDVIPGPRTLAEKKQASSK